MVSKKSHGENSGVNVGNLTYKLNQLKRQIQAERTASIKEKVEKNRKKLESHIWEILSATSSRNVLCVEENGFGKMLSSRIEIPLCKYTGFSQVSGDRDYANGHEVVSPTSAKLPYIEKLPPYTTWIFLDKNQRMAEDQSVVGRRRIYYDQQGSEALICSDSEEDTAEREEEKHEFSEGEDRILWTVCQEYGLGEEILNAVSQFIGVTISEIQERHGMLADKYSDQNIKDSEDSGSEKGISLDKSLSAALDSFDNLFCRRCLLFDCRLHGCSQTLINPIEKQPYWSEYEDDRKPCSDQCYLQLRAVKDVPEGSGGNALHGVMTTTLEEKDQAASSDVKEPKTSVGADLMQEERGISEEARPVTLEGIHDSEGAGEAQNLEISCIAIDNHESSGKRKASQERNRPFEDSVLCPDISQDSAIKKQKTVLVLDVATKSSEAIPIQDHASSESTKSRNHHVGTLNENEAQITAKNNQNESGEQGLVIFARSGSASSDKTEDNISDGAKDVTEVPELKWSSSEWKPIERELYLKGVEIFGRNSCLISRNLLSGLKTCMEVSSYMCDGGASTLHRSIVASSFLEENGKSETDYMEQEMSTRPRLLRRRGRTRKLKYSWKSAGHPSMWKRIADGKNQSCKQYTPCGCQSMCGKQCPCLHNGTCCEKYCGCSKSCKNRFRGCHCAKSQCRSRQCPCFAAGRECDPDVCRNCWVSCGGDSLGEPPKRGDGQCGNMRLLLRQQQRILLAKSDVAGWGAFLKNSVNKNDYLGEYTGELISHREADKRGKIYDRANSSFLFDLNDQYVLDAYRKGDKLKFANHSSDPNCYAKVMLVAGDHRVGIFAKERIEASEELFYDYRYGPDQAPAWARKPEGSKRDDISVSQGRAKKHQSH
ncbi:histone-lysine N-methyltransferase EZA1-like isoform X2 [Durio zibethinus]|uniref:Histone-lysine N-methyltransferase EZA1-like isoform X2 n=1 Tax=Durio zibethinus TaxID=66656 RepID=A0A6P5ZYQ1_DURZI|nr:histone-lysine N-methyltransferase EZA1-like isoform X2 [Durio zibethinus]